MQRALMEASNHVIVAKRAIAMAQSISLWVFDQRIKQTEDNIPRWESEKWQRGRLALKIATLALEDM